MDSKELMYHALSFEKVPRVPYAIEFTIPALQKLRSSAQGRDLHDRLANDLLLSPTIRVEWGARDAHGSYTDEFGLSWDRSIDPDIGIPRPMVTPENFNRIPWPDPRLPGRFEHLEANIKSHPDRFQVMSLDFSLYERAWGMRGLENMYLDMVERPGFTEALLDRILDFNLKIIEAGLEKFPEIDGVHFGDDFGDQNGISMGPERWRALIKPRLARQYGLVKSAGKKVSIHSCGRVQAILDDLVEIGVDLFNPFQPEVVDVEQVFRRYHGRLSFWGGISTQRLLPYASPGEVKQRVEQLLHMGRNGGYVIAPAHATPGDAREENMHAMLRAILGQAEQIVS
ncbi:MAG: uroporphyrinogen decarboxylase family protein [Spirochaetia bacterium]|jgi:uroporphyrinogen decarboxylase